MVLQERREIRSNYGDCHNRWSLAAQDVAQNVQKRCCCLRRDCREQLFGLVDGQEHRRLSLIAADHQVGKDVRQNARRLEGSVLCCLERIAQRPPIMRRLKQSTAFMDRKRKLMPGIGNRADGIEYQPSLSVASKPRDESRTYERRLPLSPTRPEGATTADQSAAAD